MPTIAGEKLIEEQWVMGRFPTIANGTTVRSWDGVSHSRTPKMRGSVEILAVGRERGYHLAARARHFQPFAMA